MVISFATSNVHKVRDARESLREFGVSVKQMAVELVESRSEFPRTIAKEKARQAYIIVKQPVMVEDGGFFIETLGGFPMTHIKFSLKTLGVDKVLKMLEGENNRRAYWESTVVYYDGMTLKSFTCRFPGYISEDIRPVRRTMSSDYWRIFIPARECNPRKLALSEMAGDYARANDEYYFKQSHFKKLGKWLKHNC